MSNVSRSGILSSFAMEGLGRVIVIKVYVIARASLHRITELRIPGRSVPGPAHLELPRDIWVRLDHRLGLRDAHQTVRFVRHPSLRVLPLIASPAADGCRAARRRWWRRSGCQYFWIVGDHAVDVELRARLAEIRHTGRDGVQVGVLEEPARPREDDAADVGVGEGPLRMAATPARTDPRSLSNSARSSSRNTCMRASMPGTAASSSRIAAVASSTVMFARSAIADARSRPTSDNAVFPTDRLASAAVCRTDRDARDACPGVHRAPNAILAVAPVADIVSQRPRARSGVPRAAPGSNLDDILDERHWSTKN